LFFSPFLCNYFIAESSLYSLSIHHRCITVYSLNIWGNEQMQNYQPPSPPQQPYYPYPQQQQQQWPSQQPQQPLLRARCAQGMLTITNTMIIVERGNLTSRSMPRAAFTGLDARMTLWFPGLTRYKLVIHGAGGEHIKVSSVSAKNAKKIKQLLRGY
jgi:hypothetical protein